MNTMTDEERTAEARKRLRKLFGVDGSHTSKAASPGVQARDETWEQIIGGLLGEQKLVEHPPSCPNCKSSVLGFEVKYVRTSFEAIMDTAQQGCDMCSILQAALVHSVPEDILFMDGSVTWSGLGWYYNAPEREHEKRPQVSLEIFELEGQPCSAGPLPGLKVASLLPGETASDQSFTLAQKWLQTCSTEHEKCRISASDANSPLPRRVLDVSHENVFLYENENENAQYACLSHCWGTSHPKSMTTSKTIMMYKKSIPWDSFTRNFQDAIHFCRRLQIRFLWIDCLCIVQDDDQDWREESAKMDSIYSNAYLTIAATKSSNSDGGCYSTTTEVHKARYLEQYNVYVRMALHHFPHRMWNFRSKDEFDDFPLLWRAWVCQERRLSRRVLHS